MDFQPWPFGFPQLIPCRRRRCTQGGIEEQRREWKGNEIGDSAPTGKRGEKGI